jgi:hypothetical protein
MHAIHKLARIIIMAHHFTILAIAVALSACGCAICSTVDGCMDIARESLESHDTKKAEAAARRGCELGSEESCVLSTAIRTSIPVELVVQLRGDCRAGDQEACTIIREPLERSAQPVERASGSLDDSVGRCEAALAEEQPGQSPSSAQYRQKLTECVRKLGGAPEATH